MIPKVSAQEVGEEEILNSIRDDIAGIFKDPEMFEMDQLCYCTEPLVRGLWSRPVDDWYCDSCFTKQNGRVTFQCFNELCAFRSASERIYRVCPSCFHGTRNVDKCLKVDEKEDEREDTFMYRQINCRINMISSVPIRCQWIVCMIRLYSLHIQM